MAGTITTALRTAQSGLLTTQAAVDATASNIANVNTAGYSRKIVNMETRVLAGSGSGVQLTDFTRAVDEGLLKDMRREYGTMYGSDVQTSYFDRLEALFGTPEANTSLSHILTNLNNAAESLSTSPEKTLEQNEFVRRAEEVALKFVSMSTETQSLRSQADIAIHEGVAEINNLLEQIADMNDKIIRNQAVSHDVTDLEDKRDLALNQLAEWLDISYYHRGSGDVVVFGPNGTTLVDRTAKLLTHTAITGVGPTTSYSAGDIVPIYVGAQVSENDITTTITRGRLAGLIEQRDETLPALQSQLDELASELRDAINTIHNRGTSYPGRQAMDGTRVFIDSANQQIKLSGTSDVTIALFDSNGDQQATTTLDTIMQSGLYGSGTKTSHDYWTIDEVADTVQDWLRANGAPQATVSVGSDGKLDLELSSTSLYLAFRDETATADGSTHSDATIAFDSDGDGDTDETHSGFANFFGLNDLFVDTATPDIHESSVLSSTWTSSAATLTFYDSAGGTGTALGSVSITAGSSLTTVVNAINDANIGVVASVEPDGSGKRLRIVHDNGKSLVITNAPTDTLLSSINMGIANTRTAGSFSVRSDIVATPSKLSTGAVQWDSDSSIYYSANGDSTIANALANALRTNNGFDTAGGILSRNETFDQYAAAILSDVAGKAGTNSTNLETQRSLAESLQLKADTFSGVNLDEEMSNLILYQQAYSASARVLSTIRDMFDVLNRLI